MLLRKLLVLLLMSYQTTSLFEMAEGIDKILDAQGYSMQLSSSRWIPERETTLIKSLISSRVEGILLAPVSPTSPSISILKNSGIPFTIMNCIPEDESVSYVCRR